QAFRPLDIVLCCVMGALLLILIVEYSKSSAAEQKAARASTAAREVSQQLDDIKDTLTAINKDLSDMRLAGAGVPAMKRRLDALESRSAQAPEVSPADISAAVDAALERRREAFGVDMERRGEAIAAEIARRVDLGGVQGNLNKTAENFRAGLREGEKRERTEGEKKADENIAKGFDAAAEGLDLFRKMQAGEITREEFRQKTGELRDKMRKQFEELTPEEREALRGRWGGGRPRRGREDAGEGEGEGGDEKF
ncbi:MAG: hypothetical protein ACYS9X_19715, partial [Planctomycetota bacterium]